MLTRFKQKTVLITGGASGLGKALVEQFAQLGWKIAIVDINLKGAEELSVQLKQSGIDSIACYCDVGKDEDFASIALTIQQLWGGLDIMINNAGVASANLLQDMTPEEWFRVMNLNLNSVFRGCHSWLSLLPGTGPAHIVNVASFAGLALAPGMVAYNVSKAGVIALSESLRVELGHKHIGVSVVCPAFFKTNLVNSMLESDANVKQQVNKWMESSKITATDVAKDVIKAIEKNQFMVISHDYARRFHWIKRWFPRFFEKKMMQKGEQLANLSKTQAPKKESLMKKLMIYGANGYTGELIARHAVEQGLTPILAGRNSAEIKVLADE